MQFHWIGSIFRESEISETLCCWFDRNVLLQGSEVKPEPAQIMIIYQYEYNPPDVIYNAARVWVKVKSFGMEKHFVRVEDDLCAN